MTDPEKLEGALVEARALADKYRVPVLEVILEKMTNISMGTEIDKINEFEDIDCRHPEGRQGLEMGRACWSRPRPQRPHRQPHG